jgi:hypothetical protein
MDEEQRKKHTEVALKDLDELLLSKSELNAVAEEIKLQILLFNRSYLSPLEVVNASY